MPGHPFVEVWISHRGQSRPRRLVGPMDEASRDGIEGAMVGMGLSIVEQCVRHLGGLMWIDPINPEVTRVAFTMPTAVKGS